MNPISHFFIGWSVANVARIDKRDRALVTLAGVVPDLDGLGIVVEKATQHSARPLLWWSDYHHVISHNIGFGLFLLIVVFLAAKKRVTSALLAFVAFHLHLICDLIGARGPSGEQWPIPYLLPFSDAWNLAWKGQWPLNAWPNFLITFSLIMLAGYLAWKRGYSPLEMISAKADKAFVQTLRLRFGQPH